VGASNPRIGEFSDLRHLVSSNVEIKHAGSRPYLPGPSYFDRGYTCGGEIEIHNTFTDTKPLGNDSVRIFNAKSRIENSRR
jgi:hypothetical protein